MAPLPPSSTPRFRFHYTTMAHQHTMQFRSHASPAFMGTFFHDFLTAIANSIAPITIDFVDFAPDNSDIFNLVTTGVEGQTIGTATFTPEQEAWTYTFIGRTAGGRRVRLSLYGAITLGSDYRVLSSESAAVAAALTVLRTNNVGLVGIDDVAIVWKSYIDCNANDHWIKVLRA